MSLLALAERVETLEHFACPMCGEGDFDIPGFLISHLGAISPGCEVYKALNFQDSNAEVAAALRSRAGGEHDNG